MLPSRNLLALTGLGAVVGSVAIFAAVVTRPGAELSLPNAGADPATATSTTATTGAVSDYSTDNRGYVNATARCTEGLTAAAIGRTQRSLVVICANGRGGYEYFGERISDGALLHLTADTTDNGWTSTSNGSTYTVTPSDLTVVNDGKVIYRDTWVDYHEPGPASTSTSATTTSGASTTVTVTSTVTATSTPGR